MSATLLNRPLPNLTPLPPTGQPSWPFTVLAGVEGSGKSWKAAEATGSDLVAGGYWIELGEDSAHEYGAVPGANFTIIPHRGDYVSVLDAVRWAVAQPRTDGKPRLLVFDSGSVLWELLGDEQQLIANRRAAAKAKRSNRPAPRDDEDGQITTDLWNAAKARWYTLVNLLRQYDGPALFLCRLDEVTVMEKGEPTKDKTWKVSGQKRIGYDAAVVVHLRQPYPVGRGRGDLLKARSTRMSIDAQDGIDMGADWSVDGLWHRLGLAQTPDAASYVAPDAGAYEAEYDAEQGRQEAAEAQAQARREAAARGQLPEPGVVMAQITEQVGNPDNEAARRGLLALRSSYGAANLDNVGPCELRGGMKVSADRAITRALDYVRDRVQAPGQTGAQEAPPATDTNDQGQGEPAQQGRPTSQQRMLALCVAESHYQAEVLEVDHGQYVAGLLAEVGKADVWQAPGPRFGKWLAEDTQRARTIKALREAGRDGEAARYERYGDASPVNVDAVANGDAPQEQEPAR